MDDDDFFNFAKDFTREIVSIGTSKGHINTDDSIIIKPNIKPRGGNEYAEKYKREQDRIILKVVFTF